MTKAILTICRVTLALVLFLLPSLTACGQAQKGQSEICGAVGFQSLYNLFENALANGNQHYYSTGIYNVSYRYFLRKRFTLGATLSYEYVSGRNTNATREAVITLAPEITHSYLDRTFGAKQINIRLYWLAAVGISVYKSFTPGTSPEPFPQIQLTPLGLRISKGALSGFAEAGIGFRGIVNVGLSYRFPARK